MQPLKFRGWWMTLGAVLLALVIYLCLEPADGGGVSSINDKLAHFLAFFALAGWFAALVERRFYWLVALVMLSVGGLIEVAQGLMALGRTAEALDFVADAAGVCAGILINLPIRDSWLGRLERWLTPT
jgi:VanZ family protein